MLTYKTYNGLTIYPLERGSNKNILISRVDTNHPDAITHYRSGIHEDQDKLVNLFTPSEQPDERSAGKDHLAAAKEVETTALYGGVLFWHFGHFLAESLHRLWCLDEIKHQGPIFFSRTNERREALQHRIAGLRRGSAESAWHHK